MRLAHCALAFLFACTNAVAQAADTETIVLVRHGEKPVSGLGQLSCMGLNRSLALPTVIDRMFGKPDAIFAPDPGGKKRDGGGLYDYVRPLATIEPTAVFFGLPVNADIPFDDIGRLRDTLLQSRYRNALVLVAWEHHQIDDLVRGLLADHGGPGNAVLDWKNSDFDGIYIVRIGSGSARFTRAREGLTHLGGECPS